MKGKLLLKRKTIQVEKINLLDKTQEKILENKQETSIGRIPKTNLLIVVEGIIDLNLETFRRLNSKITLQEKVSKEKSSTNLKNLQN